jgi:hypothetical protein
VCDEDDVNTLEPGSQRVEVKRKTTVFAAICDRCCIDGSASLQERFRKVSRLLIVQPSSLSLPQIAFGKKALSSTTLQAMPGLSYRCCPNTGSYRSFFVLRTTKALLSIFSVALQSIFSVALLSTMLCGSRN